MKKLIVITVLLLAGFIHAQPDQKRRRDHNPVVEAKKMTLALDLNEVQESKVTNLLKLHHQEMQQLRPDRKAMKDMKAEQKEEIKVAALDARISLQREMKAVLSSDQYEEWKEMMKKLKRAKRGKKRSERRG